MADEAIDDPDEAAAGLCARLGNGRDKCLATWLRRPNMNQ